MTGAGSGLTVTLTGAESAEQPALVTRTVYEPDWETLIDCVVAPLDQSQLVPCGALSATEPPSQKVVGPEGVMVACGGSTTRTVVCPHDSQRAPALLAEVT